MIKSISKTRVAVIGCGTWGKNLVRNFYNLGALATFVEENQDTVSLLENEYNLSGKDLSGVLQDPEIEAVIVAVPSKHHFNIARQALMAGKHLYVEKPVTLSLDQTKELLKLAEDKKRVFMSGHLPRYHPAFQTLKDLVEKGEIGRLGYIYSNRLNLGQIRADENCLWDLAPHDISMLLALSNSEVISVSAHGSSNLNPKIVDTALANITFANGVKGHIFNSWLHPFKEHRLVVIGDKGMMVFDDGNPWESKLVAYHHQIEQLDAMKFVTTPENAIPVKLAPTEPLKVECEHFLSCINEGKASLTGPDESLKVMTVLEDIQKSLRANYTDANISMAINE